MSATTEEAEMAEDKEYFSPFFEHDMLTAYIMLHQGECGNPVTFERASKVAVALLNEDDDDKIPFHLLRPQA